MFVSAVPTGLGFLIEAHPGLTPWAKIFRPAKRDSGVGALTESGFPLRIRNGRPERACHVERARPDFIGVPYECRFCTRRGDWAVRVETPLSLLRHPRGNRGPSTPRPPDPGPQRAPHLRAMGWRVAKKAGRKFFAGAALRMTSPSS